MFSSHIF
jgi:hypothetical protein